MTVRAAAVAVPGTWHDTNVLVLPEQDRVPDDHGVECEASQCVGVEGPLGDTSRGVRGIAHKMVPRVVLFDISQYLRCRWVCKLFMSLKLVEGQAVTCLWNDACSWEHGASL